MPDFTRELPIAVHNMSGWGRQLWIDAHVIQSESLATMGAHATLSRGLGRAYGDAALPPRKGGLVLQTTLANRILSFDSGTGVIRAEAGLSLRELIRIVYPHGWFSPVIPGTSYVTLGGMVAADVHGKNHHSAGSFGRHVRSLLICAGNGQIYECDRKQNADLFLATIGGMGLTGHILEIELALERIASPWIVEISERFGSLERVFAALRKASGESPMTVAWIDTSARGAALGRGIVMRGRWAEPREARSAAPPQVPHPPKLSFDFPDGLVNPFTAGILNSFWYLKHGARARTRMTSPYSFFWPLDALGAWNRAFGTRGFIQYQCVLPPDLNAFARLLELFRKHRASSFVSVLKDSGPEGDGLLSFLKQGTTIAIDIPVRTTEEARETTHAFNAHVIASGGRIYLAKDSYTTADEFKQMYPRIEEFRSVLRKYDPAGRIGSALSERLFRDGSASV